MMAVQTNGGRADNGALALLAIPYLLPWQQQWQWCKQRAQLPRWRLCGQRCLGIVGHSLPSRATTMTAVVCPMMPNKKKWQQHGQWCLGIVTHSLPCCAMATASATETMVCNDGGGGSADNGALALVAIPHSLLR
jgi:hypothetical protein